MSTFKQIVEGYAGNTSNQGASMDYKGASDRAVDKIRNERKVDSGISNLLSSSSDDNYFKDAPATERGINSRELHPLATQAIIRIRNGVHPDKQVFNNIENTSRMLDNSFIQMKDNKSISDNDLFHIFSELAIAKQHLGTASNRLKIGSRMAEVLNHPNVGPATKAAFAMHHLMQNTAQYLKR